MTNTPSAPSLSIAMQSKLNGNHPSIIQNSSRHTNPQHKNSTITNGFTNGNTRIASFPSVSVMMNGLSSPGKRKSRDSRDNSPVPPAFSRQHIKVESLLPDPNLPKLNKEELRSINLRNQNMRQIIYKEVKRPGKNHDRLIKMLKHDLHGPPQIRREYIKEVIAEAGRFKRKALVDVLEQRMEELIVIAAT